MTRVFEGKLSGAGKQFGIVASRFNDFIVNRLLEGAMDCLQRHGTGDDQVEVVWVPGSFEIPLAAKRMAKSGKYNAVICLGCVIRGGTPHFDYIAAEAAKGTALAGLESELPVVFGVLTTDTVAQAIERAGTKMGNKGWQAALTAIEMANLWSELDK